MSKKFVSPSDYILPININGLEGRVLRLRALNKHNKKEILVIYDQQSNLERWWGLYCALRSYANVTAVDLPGIGGMESFYKIGLKPSINNFADYLESFVRLRYKKTKVTVVAIGFGFVIVNRMLQRSQAAASKTNLVVGFNAYAHHSDLKFRKKPGGLIFAETLLVSLPLGGLAAQALKSFGYLRSYTPGKAQPRKKIDPFTKKFLSDLEKDTDLRTLIAIRNQLARLDNCTERLDLPLWSVSFGDQKMLRLAVSEQHLRVAFSKYRQLSTKFKNIPFIIKDEKTGLKMLPAALRRELKKPVR